MNMIEAKNKDEYNKFIIENNGNFQQSWEWGELQERMGRKTKRLLALDEQGKPQVAASFVRHDLPFDKFYWVAPRGPVIEKQIDTVTASPDIISGRGSLLGLLRALSPRNDRRDSPRDGSDAIFLRVEPELSADYRLSIMDYSLREAPHDHSPRATILIDLEKSEKELLFEMHSKTRYNLRLSGRKEVNVKISDERLEIRDFLDLLEKTAERDEFNTHPRKYYEYMLELPFIKLFTAHLPPLNPPLTQQKANPHLVSPLLRGRKRGGSKGGRRVAAGAIVSFFGNRATYLHGASDYESRKFMAPHLLHWEIIKQAKKQGIKYYDLGGVALKTADKNHPWQGISKFKQGFGGEYIEYVGTLDYVTNPLWYMIYKLGRRVL